MARVADLEAVLPQTQCGECGYSGCRPYAEALAQGHTSIDRCPPGGLNTLNALAALLHQDPSVYYSTVAANTRPPSTAMIREAECIGCTKCIQACPVDAIIGSAKQMHSVLPDECTGCGLCVEPCPVDCIEMLPIASPQYDKSKARARFQARQIRLLRDAQMKEQIYQEKRRLAQQAHHSQADKKAKQAFILQALARVQSKQHE